MSEKLRLNAPPDTPMAAYTRRYYRDPTGWLSFYFWVVAAAAQTVGVAAAAAAQTASAGAAGQPSAIRSLVVVPTSAPSSSLLPPTTSGQSVVHLSSVGSAACDPFLLARHAAANGVSETSFNLKILPLSSRATEYGADNTFLNFRVISSSSRLTNVGSTTRHKYDRTVYNPLVHPPSALIEPHIWATPSSHYSVSPSPTSVYASTLEPAIRSRIMTRVSRPRSALCRGRQPCAGLFVKCPDGSAQVGTSNSSQSDKKEFRGNGAVVAARVSRSVSAFGHTERQQKDANIFFRASTSIAAPPRGNYIMNTGANSNVMSPTVHSKRRLGDTAFLWWPRHKRSNSDTVGPAMQQVNDDPMTVAAVVEWSAATSSCYPPEECLSSPSSWDGSSTSSYSSGNALPTQERCTALYAEEEPAPAVTREGSLAGRVTETVERREKMKMKKRKDCRTIVGLMDVINTFSMPLLTLKKNAPSSSAGIAGDSRLLHAATIAAEETAAAKNQYRKFAWPSVLWIRGSTYAVPLSTTPSSLVTDSHPLLLRIVKPNVLVSTTTIHSQTVATPASRVLKKSNRQFSSRLQYRMCMYTPQV